MADFSNVVITEKGKSLIAKLQGNQDTLIFTTIKTSSKVYSKEDLYNLSNIDFIKQQRAINKVNYESPNMIKIVCKLDNKDITESGYNLCSYGIYAKSKKNPEEILFAAVSTNDISKADWISPSSALNAITINLNTVLIVSNVEVAEVTISDEGVTSETFNEHTNSKGINAVHGATDEAEAGAIVSRGVDGSAEIEYPTKPTDKTIVNKSALDLAIKNAEVPRGTLINYFTKGVTYKVNEYVAIDDENKTIPEIKEPTIDSGNTDKPSEGGSTTPTNPDTGKDDSGETKPTEPTEPTEPENPSGGNNKPEAGKTVLFNPLDQQKIGTCIFVCRKYIYKEDNLQNPKNVELIEYWQLYNGTWEYNNFDELTVSYGTYKDGYFENGRDKSYYGF